MNNNIIRKSNNNVMIFFHMNFFSTLFFPIGDRVLSEFMDGLVQEHQRRDDLVSA